METVCAIFFGFDPVHRKDGAYFRRGLYLRCENRRRCLRMFTNAKCLRALCADPRVQRGRVQWNLACVSRKGSEGRAVAACAREGVSTLGELPFRAGNNRNEGRCSSLAAQRVALTNGCGKDGGFLSLSRFDSPFFVNILKKEQRGRRREGEFVPARLRSTFQKY